MALSGIDIFKLLPKTNCKECNMPTCLAFAMKLAGGQAKLEDCPYVSEEAKAALAEAAAPPMVQPNHLISRLANMAEPMDTPKTAVSRSTLSFAISRYLSGSSGCSNPSSMAKPS